MPISCPKCSQQLPQVETLKYRFCPHCGAEVVSEPENIDDAYVTIPPDLAAHPPRQTPQVPDSETDSKTISSATFNHKTSAPQPLAGQSQPKIKPPDTPPPPGFLRTPTAEKTPPIESKVKGPAPEQKPKPSQSKTRTLIIAGLIIVAVIILILGGLFTF